MTRARLQNYRVRGYKRELVSKEMEKICRAVEAKVLTTNECVYLYEIPVHMKHSQSNPEGCVRELLTAIVTHFPDSSIVMDPLEIFIGIDWS